jgi:murein L,D-transpeptidase YcbB/YkuD
MKATVLLFVLFSAIPPAVYGSQGSGVPDPSQQIEQILGSVSAMDQPIFMQSALQTVYARRQFQPVWTDQQKIGEVIKALEASAEYGLLPRDYHLPAIQSLVRDKSAFPEPERTAALDVLLSDGLLLYIHHRREGKVHPRELYPEFNFDRDHSADLQPVELMLQASIADNLAAFIDAQAPAADYYDQLRHQLARYRELEATGGWHSVPPGPTLRQGDRGARVAAIRMRLQVTGELPAESSVTEDVFGPELESAVNRFQSRHGLATDGLVGKQTLAAMNADVHTRVNQLRLSLERLRWLEHNSDTEFVAVNIASFQLAYIKNQAVVWVTRIVAGTPFRRTPVFRSLMTYVEFNPTWTIPPTILREDTLPAIRRNPDYLADRDISVIDTSGRKVDPGTINWNEMTSGMPYSLRQEPGPNNALGLVKFIFPNPFSVYMHDTPQQSLFDKPMRGFSSGCIRVENPFHLVNLVLGDQENFSSVKLENILRSGRTQRVWLEKPVPVMILYLTATLGDAGEAAFYPDIYDRDAALLTVLDGPVTVH